MAVHAPGEADLNLYAYVHGKVLVAVDPVGLSIWDYAEGLLDQAAQAAAAPIVNIMKTHDAAVKGDAKAAVGHVMEADPTGTGGTLKAVVDAGAAVLSGDVDAADLIKAHGKNAGFVPRIAIGVHSAVTAPSDYDAGRAALAPVIDTAAIAGAAYAGLRARAGTSDVSPATQKPAPARATPAPAPEPEPTVRLRHGTTVQRANSIRRNGPDPSFEEPGGGAPADGFSTARANSPSGVGTPEQYARGKADLFPNEGGPAVLEVDVPKSIVRKAIRAEGEVRFDPGYGLEELKGSWGSLKKNVSKLDDGK